MKETHVIHKVFGNGIIISRQGNYVDVDFEDVGTKVFNINNLSKYFMESDYYTTQKQLLELNIAYKNNSIDQSEYLKEVLNLFDSLQFIYSRDLLIDNADLEIISEELLLSRVSLNKRVEVILNSYNSKTLAKDTAVNKLVKILEEYSDQAEIIQDILAQVPHQLRSESKLKQKYLDYADLFFEVISCYITELTYLYLNKKVSFYVYLLHLKKIIEKLNQENQGKCKTLLKNVDEQSHTQPLLEVVKFADIGDIIVEFFPNITKLIIDDSIGAYNRKQLDMKLLLLIIDTAAHSKSFSKIYTDYIDRKLENSSQFINYATDSSNIAEFIKDTINFLPNVTKTIVKNSIEVYNDKKFDIKQLIYIINTVINSKNFSRVYMAYIDQRLKCNKRFMYDIINDSSLIMFSKINIANFFPETSMVLISELSELYCNRHNSKHLELICNIVNYSKGSLKKCLDNSVLIEDCFLSDYSPERQVEIVLDVYNKNEIEYRIVVDKIAKILENIDESKLNLILTNYIPPAIRVSPQVLSIASEKLLPTSKVDLMITLPLNEKEIYWSIFNRTSKVYLLYAAFSLRNNDLFLFLRKNPEKSDPIIQALLKFSFNKHPAILSKTFQDLYLVIQEEIRNDAWQVDKSLEWIKIFIPKCVEGCTSYCEGKPWKNKDNTAFCPRKQSPCDDNDGARIWPNTSRVYYDWSLLELFYVLGFKPKVTGLADSNQFVPRFAGWVNRLEEIRERLRCSNCGSVLISNKRYSVNLAAYSATVFYCPNGSGHDNNVYISHCWGCGKVIDSRDCGVKDNSGYYLCLHCGSGSRNLKLHGSICPYCGEVDMKQTSEYSYECIKCKHKIKIPKY